jgi:hypothetical protein
MAARRKRSSAARHRFGVAGLEGAQTGELAFLLVLRGALQRRRGFGRRLGVEEGVDPDEWRPVRDARNVGAGCQKGLDLLFEQSVYVLAGVGRMTRPRTSAPAIAPIRGSRR